MKQLIEINKHIQKLYESTKIGKVMNRIEKNKMKMIKVILGDYFKTSAEWQKLKPKIIILAPDGWNRKNYEYSWNEEPITEQEYKNRRVKSTCKWLVPIMKLTEQD